MARCTKCGAVLYTTERGNITMDTESRCGFKHKSCDKAIGVKKLTKDIVPVVTPKKKKVFPRSSGGVGETRSSKLDNENKNNDIEKET